MSAILEVESLTKRFGGITAVDRCTFSVPSETITDEAHFVNDLGVDSLMALEIMVALEKKYQIKIPEKDLLRITCLNNVYEIVKEKRG